MATTSGDEFARPDDFSDSVPIAPSGPLLAETPETAPQYLNISDFGAQGQLDVSLLELPGPYVPELQNAVNQEIMLQVGMLNDPSTYSNLEWMQSQNRLLLAFDQIAGDRGSQSIGLLQEHYNNTVISLGNDLGIDIAMPSIAPVVWSSNMQLVTDPNPVTWNGVPLNEAADEIDKARKSVKEKTGGGGSSGPVYNAPDRRTVEELVRAHLNAKTANVDEGNVTRLTDMYMTDHKRNWTSQKGGAGQIDPEMTVVEEIRKQPDYVSIHKNRPTTEAEDTWVGQQINALKQQGVGAETARKRGQQVASLGSGRAAEASPFLQQSTGTATGFLQKAASVGQVIGGLIQ